MHPNKWVAIIYTFIYKKYANSLTNICTICTNFKKKISIMFVELLKNLEALLQTYLYCADPMMSFEKIHPSG